MVISFCQLILNLRVLKMARDRLLNDHNEENPEIYIPLFRYERDYEQMRLSVDKYYLNWLNYHWIIFEYYLKDQEFSDTTKKELKDSFLKVFVALLRKWDLKGNHSENTDLFLQLLRKRINLLSDIIELGDKEDKKYNRLVYEHERDKVLFEREFNRLKGE